MVKGIYEAWPAYLDNETVPVRGADATSLGLSRPRLWLSLDSPIPVLHGLTSPWPNLYLILILNHPCRHTIRHPSGPV